MKVGEVLKADDLQMEMENISDDTYVGWRVKIRFRDTVEGGIPLDPEMIRNWLYAMKAKGKLKLEDAEIEELIRKTTEQVYVPEIPEEEREKVETERKVKSSWQGFKTDEKGLYIEARQVQACLKEVVNTLKMAKALPGLRQLLQHGTYVRGEAGGTEIHLGVMEPDASRESIVHTPRFGSSFKRNDYVDKPLVEFYVYYAKVGQLMTDDRFVRIMMAARENGLGTNRAEGVGKFDILELEKVQDPKSAGGDKKDKEDKEDKKETGKQAK